MLSSSELFRPLLCTIFAGDESRLGTIAASPANNIVSIFTLAYSAYEGLNFGILPVHAGVVRGIYIYWLNGPIHCTKPQYAHYLGSARVYRTDVKEEARQISHIPRHNPLKQDILASPCTVISRLLSSRRTQHLHGGNLCGRSICGINVLNATDSAVIHAIRITWMSHLR
ncbi:hypothetical protein NEOLEDRAFT_241358 [Neolentinus lepideus HHB14362 ss-1]|uniref:Uncharacterized protein n=1 Tax=Neolentinus lepideus HHB14362 ss-1 TaxID=1314782 RepID=A0A165T6V4_9AGAM|nr:hypothetical protein NEOLEDRAFT_241358 [Neolentinus lepideus HHB14362 ss-1]